MKYLIMEDFSGNPIPFIFPRLVDHADMRDQLPYTKILSGGYIELNQGIINCSGGYPALDIKATDNDAIIISKALEK